MDNLKKVIIAIFIFLFVLELGSLCFVKISDKFSSPSYILNTSPKSLDLNENFGVWHLPNSRFIHKQDCIDVVYEFNSYGARDKERSPNSNSKNRFFLIGDSMIEGYGIDTSGRLSNLLEKDLGIEFLNFGTAGGFGSIQMLQLYRYFKDKFEHNKVIVALFPTNDFSDNSYEYGQYYFKKRYKPYFLPTEKKDSFTLVYSLDELK